MDFYEVLARYYDQIFPLKAAQQGFLKRYFGEHNPSSVLDVGCGTGSVALAVSDWGIRTVGIDLSREMIEIARQRATALNSSAQFFMKNMLELGSFQDDFDSIICLGNTFVHLITTEQLEKALSLFKQKADHLLIQIVNYDRILAQNVSQLPEITTSELTFRRFYNHLPDGLIEFSTELHLLEENETIKAANLLRPLTRPQLTQLLEHAGWESLTWFGSYAGEVWSEDSPATIVKAE